MFAAYPAESPGDSMFMLNPRRIHPYRSILSVGQALIYVSPLMYGNDLILAAYSGSTPFSPRVDIAMFCIFIQIFQSAVNRLYTKFND